MAEAAERDSEHESHLYKLPMGSLVDNLREVVKDQVQQLRALASVLQERHQKSSHAISSLSGRISQGRTRPGLGLVWIILYLLYHTVLHYL